MAYSGTRTFNLNIEEIIEEAYERCGLEVRSGYDLKTARRSLNLMFSDFSVRIFVKIRKFTKLEKFGKCRSGSE